MVRKSEWAINQTVFSLVLFGYFLTNFKHKINDGGLKWLFP